MSSQVSSLQRLHHLWINIYSIDAIFRRDWFKQMPFTTSDVQQLLPNTGRQQLPDSRGPDRSRINHRTIAGFVDLCFYHYIHNGRILTRQSEGQASGLFDWLLRLHRNLCLQVSKVQEILTRGSLALGSYEYWQNYGLQSFIFLSPSLSCFLLRSRWKRGC